MNALVQTNNGQASPHAGLASQACVDKTQYLTFMLGGEVFAIGILAIKEIIEYRALTEVPMMPDCIRGVINLRGAVVPVMDLSARFGKQTAAATKRTCIVIVEIESSDGRHDIGVVVDAVNAVLEIAAIDIEPPPSFGARIRTDFIQGIGKVDGKFVILLNVSQVLSTDEVGALVEIGGKAQTEAMAAA